ncbi:MAG: 50S ribosomal protein L5 [Candidatus Portnoybacteria bacterium CG10_big_fil_rev_8_21_14_0_10_44_7]|uniref:Large ribosomal subunit protein uL5 n=1 Tax=Candidatus Portnoybacteria bacterium CG10_big_fil_rev_8_21_14_0_10_44_7 TaxID=1974816 RepID=A0A2M8KIJ5_9BACT|nr:MAG: 50S ribosomal protein L5 [Candidatus Portnoybacteria bacterium CG10_big_fil_rev_8_21_14_0_10_44_7]
MNLKEKYNREIKPALQEQLKLTNQLAVPAPVKAVVNIGVGKYRDDQEAQKAIVHDLALLTGQQPQKTFARQAIAGFKIRRGSHVGYKITLRGRKMYDFISRLFNLSLPRTRDFRGLPEKSVDQAGNLTLGIKEHIVFPEISHENVRFIFSLEVVLVSSARSRQEALALFRLLGVPFRVAKKNA